VIHDGERDPRRLGADRLDETVRLGAGVDLAAAGGEERDRSRARAELERHLDVALERAEDVAHGGGVASAERARHAAASVACLSRRYARYGSGSISDEPVSRSIVSFGVSLRPSA